MGSFLRKLFLNFLFLFFISLFSQGLAELFLEIKQVNEKNYPKYFSCALISTIITLQLKNIPPNMVEFNQEPTLYLSLTQKKPPQLKLKGVLPFYENYFLPYEELMGKAGLFIGVDNYFEFSSLQKAFNIEVMEKEKTTILTLSEKDSLPGDYGKYFFDEKKRLVKSAYYENNLESVNLSFFYQKKKQYTLPKRIIVRVIKPRKLDQVENISQYFIDFKRCSYQ